MNDIAKEIVDQIEDGKMDSAKETIFKGLLKRSAENIDMKRVETQVNWMIRKKKSNENLSTDDIELNEQKIKLPRVINNSKQKFLLERILST